MEACGSAHHWGRQIIALGHTCKLIPPIYVKPFLKRQKNDSNDAAAIVEAVQRPTMRFVAVKSEEAQADAMLFRTRALLVRQRTQTINSLRGQLAEFGVIAAQGVGSIAMLRFEWGTAKATLPEQVVSMTELLFEKIAGLEKEIRSRTRALFETINQNGTTSGVSVLALPCWETTHVRRPSFCLLAPSRMALFGWTSGKNRRSRPSSGRGQVLGSA